MRLVAWLGPLLFLGSLLAHIHCEDVFGIVGENFTFPVKIDQKITEIIWTKNKDKVAEWEGQTNPTYFTSLRNRGLLNKDYGSLTIFNLENSDAGTYVLDYFDSGKKNYVLTFTLAVLDPPSEPEISCNISGDDLLLKCTADFQKPLHYTWKFSSTSITRQTQEVVIPKTIVDASEKALCFIKFSQTEKSSEISFTQCFPDNPGHSYQKRSRVGLIVAFLFGLITVITAFLCVRAATKRGTRGAAQMNRSVCASGENEQLFPGDSQEQSNSDRGTSSQAIDCENEKPEADKELNKEDGALKDKQTVNSGANQEELCTKQNSALASKCGADNGASEEDISKTENSSLLVNHTDDQCANEGGSGREHEDSVALGMEERGEEVTQDAEGRIREHLSSSASCRTEDLKSEANNCSVEQTTAEEKQ